jgi:hypothetical protein
MRARWAHTTEAGVSPAATCGAPRERCPEERGSPPVAQMEGEREGATLDGNAVRVKQP